MNGVELQPQDFDPEAVEPHLRPHYLVEDGDSQCVAEGDALDELQQQLRGQARRELRTAVDPQWQRDSITAWDFDDLPATVSVAGQARATPALVAENDHVALHVYESPAEAAVVHRAGVRALLRLQLADRVRDLRKAARPRFGMNLIGTPLTAEALADDLVERCADELIGETPPRTAAAFSALIDRRSEFSQLGYRRLDEIVAWIEAVGELRRKLATERQRPAASLADLRRQLDTLFAPGFVSAIPTAQWPRIAIYLRAAALRWERMGNRPQRDVELTQELAPWVVAVTAPWSAARWILEEWRVQLFAQELRAIGAPTAEKIRAALG
jgi:ATP-dependent helicase HrpA